MLRRADHTLVVQVHGVWFHLSRRPLGGGWLESAGARPSAQAARRSQGSPGPGGTRSWLSSSTECTHVYHSVTRVVSSVRTKTGINTVWCCKYILSQPSSATCALLVTAGWGPGPALYFIVCLCVCACILYICVYLYICIYICLHFLRPYFFRIGL